MKHAFKNLHFFPLFKRKVGTDTSVLLLKQFSLPRCVNLSSSEKATHMARAVIPNQALGCENPALSCPPHLKVE